MVLCWRAKRAGSVNIVRQAPGQKVISSQEFFSFLTRVLSFTGEALYFSILGFMM